VAPLEPHLPWRPDILRARAECFERAGDPRAKQAAADLQAFLGAEKPTLASPPAPITGPTGLPR